jgi:leucyl aminopeptidase (aminopeptidase T)
MDASMAAKNALKYVFEAKPGDNIVIFCDDIKMSIGEAFANGAQILGLNTRLVRLQTSPESFRNDIPSQILEFLTAKRPNIYINLMRGVREETPFRIKLIQMETSDHKTRLGHCPGVTEDMLTEGALALTAAEHRQMQELAEKLMERLKQAVRIEIRNPAGTRVSLNVDGRPFFTDTKIDWTTMKWMNLPTGEVIVAPVEDSLEGKIVCDMAIGGIGPISTPVEIIAKNGGAQEVTSADVRVLQRVQDSLATDAMSKIVGEFAFGINSKARFTEEFLESEKMLGTIHIAFGNNSDFPQGKNNSENHMDFMISKPTVKIFTKTASTIILANGIFQEPDKL